MGEGAQLKDRNRLSRGPALPPLVLWAVDDGDPQERTEIVWARSKEKALRLGWTVFRGDWSRQDFSECVMSARQLFDMENERLSSGAAWPKRLRWLRGFFSRYGPGTSGRSREMVEGRPAVLRLAGLRWEGEPVCEVCYMGETGSSNDPEEWRVCSECNHCGECGHDDECAHDPWMDEPEDAELKKAFDDAETMPKEPW